LTNSTQKISKKYALKDELFNPKKVTYLAKRIKKVYQDFDAEDFTNSVVNTLPNLELKARIFHIANCLEIYLPQDFKTAVTIILNALPPELNPNKCDGDFGDFIFAPLSEYVANNGLHPNNLPLAFNALSALTKRFSVEFSIRAFINQHPIQSFDFLHTLARSNNYHQRRLSSEGLRPKLPWAKGVDFDYQKPIEILDILCTDPTRYVVRSVANHLNDIAKIDANLTINTLKRWQSEGKQIQEKSWHYLTQHALRTLVKQGNPDALALLGFKKNPAIKVLSFNIKDFKITLNEYLEFSFKIQAISAENLMIDYKIIYPSTHTKISEKVFKIKSIKTEKNATITIKKRHLFKPMSTKKLYAGTHQIQLQINGKIFIKENFELYF
jgi:3-methyladenine DNA glycosylase AlkC